MAEIICSKFHYAIYVADNQLVSYGFNKKQKVFPGLVTRLSQGLPLYVRQCSAMALQGPCPSGQAMAWSKDGRYTAVNVEMKDHNVKAARHLLEANKV